MQLSLSLGRNMKKKKTKEPSLGQFPWLAGLLKNYQILIVNNNTTMRSLLNLVTIFTDYVTREVSSCYSKPNRAAKLKKNMVLLIGLFHSCYENIKGPLHNVIYMDKMSELLTMYMDMEIKASRRGKESQKKISGKLLSSLFVVLDNSAERILDTILKVRFILKTYSEIIIPIFKRITKKPVLEGLNYVRYLLLFKLWKRLLPKGEDRNSINRIAVFKLSPPSPLVMEMIKQGKLSKVLPTLQLKPELVTRHYMTAKINLRESIKALASITSEMNYSELMNLALETARDLEDSTEQTTPEDSQQVSRLLYYLEIDFLSSVT